MKYGPLWFFIVITMALATTVRSMPSEQFPSFQPLHLAFDQSNNRLYVAIPGQEASKSHVSVFQDPETGATVPDPSFDLAGTTSGLSYDPISETLFVASATTHMLQIFDRINPRVSTRPSRILQRFNFPTGIYFEPSRDRLFVADAHPGALHVYKNATKVEGEERPDISLSGEKTGLNGPYGIAADTERSLLYVSNFDGVLVFSLRNLSIPPERIALPEGTLARGLSFDPNLNHLFIAAPMLRSFFIYDGKRLERVELKGAEGIFPFSIAIDPKSDRLYLAGTKPEVGVIDMASNPDLQQRSQGEIKRSIDRWIRWKGAHTPPFRPPHHRESPLPLEKIPGRI